MSQIKDFPNRDEPVASDFVYLITEGNTDYKLSAKQILGESNKLVTGSTYTLLLTDQFRTIRMNFNGAKTLTIPADSSVPYEIGTVIRVRNSSPDTLTMIPEGAAVDLYSKNGWLNIMPRGEVKLCYVATDTWEIIGDLSS